MTLVTTITSSASISIRHPQDKDSHERRGRKLQNTYSQRFPSPTARSSPTRLGHLKSSSRIRDLVIPRIARSALPRPPTTSERRPLSFTHLDAPYSRESDQRLRHSRPEVSTRIALSITIDTRLLSQVFPCGSAVLPSPTYRVPMLTLQNTSDTTKRQKDTRKKGTVVGKLALRSFK